VIKKFDAINIVSAATLWGSWKLRNKLCLKNAVWLNVKQLLWRVAGLARNWLILCPVEKKEKLNNYIMKLHSLARKTRNATGMKVIRSLCVKQWIVQLRELEKELETVLGLSPGLT
jgi:hypothetical protein